MNLGENLFVSSQIVAEVHRNRVNVAIEFLSLSWQKKALAYSLPAHLLSIEAAQLESLTQKSTDFKNKSEALSRDLDQAYKQTIDDIAHGRDLVSKQLEQILLNAVEPTADELNRARFRKEIGNPPGKRTDPLGDQLTWEQFLSHIHDEHVVWIITGDSDYCYELPNKTLCLNPVLASDVQKAVGGQVDIRCYTTLADGLKDASKTLKLKPAKQITQEEMEVIRKSEIENARRLRTPAIFCPVCGVTVTWDAIKSANTYVGQAIFFTCPICGSSFDTDRS